MYQSVNWFLVKFSRYKLSKQWANKISQSLILFTVHLRYERHRLLHTIDYDFLICIHIALIWTRLDNLNEF